MARRLTNLLAATALVTGLALVIASADEAQPQPAAPAAAREKPKKTPWDSPASRFVFFAVLEGLYEDGVSQETIDIIIPVKGLVPTETNPAPTGYRDMTEHFVHMCPLCHPTFEAMRLYAGRQPFVGQKARVDTFGDGLPEEILKKLHSGLKTDRLEGIRTLIDRWVSRRLDMHNLTARQRAEMRLQINALRDKGTEQLKLYQRAGEGNAYNRLYADWKFCGACDGSLDGAKSPAASANPHDVKTDNTKSETTP